MTAKEYLWSVRLARDRIKRLNETRDEIITSMRMVSSPSLQERVQTSPRDRMPELMAELESNEAEILSAIENETKLIIKIGQQIDKLKADEREKQVLHLRYILCMDWNRLYNAMAYSESRCHQWHRSALNKFYNQYMRKRIE